MEKVYEHKTAFYQQGRLGYAPETMRLIAKVLGAPPAVMADMGSGSGILTESLLEKGYAVYGVEPDTALQQKALERLGHDRNFSPVAASAEDTGLPGRSVDGITAASAFHWFDAGRFLNECRRLLKPAAMYFCFTTSGSQTTPSAGSRRASAAGTARGLPGFPTARTKQGTAVPPFLPAALKKGPFPMIWSIRKSNFSPAAFPRLIPPTGPGRIMGTTGGNWNV